MIRQGLLDLDLGEAVFSPCRTYRYALVQRWDDELPIVMFVSLNPSTGDLEKSDPTLRRLRGFAGDWGFGGVAALNLFAFRTPMPSVMRVSSFHPVGPDNDKWLRHYRDICDCVVASWGIYGHWHGRDEEVIAMMPKMTEDSNNRAIVTRLEAPLSQRLSLV